MRTFLFWIGGDRSFKQRRAPDDALGGERLELFLRQAEQIERSQSLENCRRAGRAVAVIRLF